MTDTLFVTVPDLRVPQNSGAFMFWDSTSQRWVRCPLDGILRVPEDSIVIARHARVAPRGASFELLTGRAAGSPAAPVSHSLALIPSLPYCASPEERFGRRLMSPRLPSPPSSSFPMPYSTPASSSQSTSGDRSHLTAIPGGSRPSSQNHTISTSLFLKRRSTVLEALDREGHTASASGGLKKRQRPLTESDESRKKQCRDYIGKGKGKATYRSEDEDEDEVIVLTSSDEDTGPCPRDRKGKGKEIEVIDLTNTED